MPTIKVVIDRVKTNTALPNWDIFTAPDFSATVTIDGKSQSTRRIANDAEISPNWEFTVDTTETRVPISVQLWDEKIAPDRNRHHADINPQGGKQDLNLIFDTTTNQIEGVPIVIPNDKIASFPRGDIVLTNIPATRNINTGSICESGS